MNFSDRVIVRLADRAQRAALFDALSLEQIAAAAWDVAVDGPFSAVFDEVTMGFSVTPPGVIEGMWGSVAAADRIQMRLVSGGLAAPPPLQFDALWRGAIVARVQPATSPVTGAEVAFPDLGSVDAAIIAALGALPADPATLEQERRTRVLQQIRNTLDQPAAFSDGQFDRWLASVGAASASDLLTRFSTSVYGAGVRVILAPAAPLSPTPLRLPITAAVVVRDAPDFSVRTMLLESKAIRAALQEAGVETPTEVTLRQRHAIVVIWLIAQTVFDDTDWPGGDNGSAEQRRALRRAAAALWLQSEGIVLAPIV